MIGVSKIQPGRFSELLNYLWALSNETKNRFGPHAFNLEGVQAFYADLKNRGYLAIYKKSGRLIGYAVIHFGFLEHDAARLRSYGIILSADTDSTFAPSVADDWQGKGVGKALFSYILSDICLDGQKRMILWGGVQKNNERAIGYYQTLGFQMLGQFEYRGWNQDMVLDLSGGLEKG